MLIIDFWPNVWRTLLLFHLRYLCIVVGVFTNKQASLPAVSELSFLSSPSEEQEVSVKDLFQNRSLTREAHCPPHYPCICKCLSRDYVLRIAVLLVLC